MSRLKSISLKQMIAIGLILIGVGLTIRYAWRTSTAFRALEFARAHNFDQGNPDPNWLRAWMNMEYVAVAFSVPQEFIYSELNITMESRNSRMSLADLNDEFRASQRNSAGRPVMVDEVRAAIVKYQADPVSTGLKEGGVRSWMNVQYVANSTGISATEIFKQIGVPEEGNAYKGLERLADETHYKGGVNELIKAIQQVVDKAKVSP